MKKYLIITILIMTFGIIPKVKALNYDYNIGQEVSVNNVHWDRNITIASSNSQSGVASTDFTFNQTYQFNNSKFIRFTYTSELVTTNNANELINWTETCNSTQFITATGAKTYTVTYADGSHATITGNITDYEGYCSQYTSTGTVTSSSINITEFTPQIYLMTTGGGSWSQCEMDNSFILCPVTPNLNYSGLRLYYYRQSFNDGNAYFSIYLRKDVLTINSDAQAIINNNNTNYNNFNNSDINSQSKTPLDTTNSDSVNQKETQIYDVIKQSPNELDILSIDLDPDTNSWIWTTINTLIAQHRYITILFVSIMTIGVAKLIFGR